MFKEHSKLEVVFDYTGFRQLGHGCTLLRHENLNGEGTEDIGTDTGRLALLDVLVDMNGGGLHFAFLYNRHMKHQEKICGWSGECRRCLKVLIDDTSS